MSELRVDKISPQSGTEMTLGDNLDDFLLPSGAEIKAKSGSTITIESGATLANAGTATGFGGGAWTFIRSQTASSSSSMEFTQDIDNTYDVYKIVYADLEFSADNTFKFRTGVSSYDTGSTDYEYAFSGAIANGTSDAVSLGADGIKITNTAYQDGSATGSAHMIVHLFTPSDTTHTKTIAVQFVGQSSSGAAHHIIGAGQRSATAAYTRIQLTPHTGTIISGTARLYGLSNS